MEELIEEICDAINVYENDDYIVEVIIPASIELDNYDYYEVNQILGYMEDHNISDLFEAEKAYRDSL